MMDGQSSNSDHGTVDVEDGVWHPPTQSSYVVETSSPALASTSHDSHVYVDAGHLSHGYATQAHFSGNQYHEVRQNFAGKLSFNTWC